MNMTTANMQNNAATDAQAQADAQMRSVRAMVAALDLDYDRLQDLRKIANKQRSVVHGSMRPADLILAFAHELADMTSHEQVVNITGFTPDNAPADGDAFWDNADAADILESLFDALDSAAPAGCYFGAHPGDGSDYGFWMTEEDAEELAELEAAADGCSDRDDAEQRIHDDALSVEVRSDWHAPGDEEGSYPSEFRILLCTGGPAVQIRGTLDEFGEPCRAWLEFQDWGTPWTERVNREGDQAALIEYARCFYFGQ